MICFLKRQARIIVFLNVNRSAVDKAQIPKKLLHGVIISVGIDPQMSALFEGPNVYISMPECDMISVMKRKSGNIKHGEI